MARFGQSVLPTAEPCSVDCARQWGSSGQSATQPSLQKLIEERQLTRAVTWPPLSHSTCTRPANVSAVPPIRRNEAIGQLPDLGLCS
jgi:hypothetical protein